MGNQMPSVGVRSMPWGGEEEPITIIKPEQIVIAAVIMHLLLIERLDNNAKLPIKGSNLAAGIDIMAIQDIIILPRPMFLSQYWNHISSTPRDLWKAHTLKWFVVKHGIDIGAGVIDEDY
jgi:dUTPase